MASLNEEPININETKKTIPIGMVLQRKIPVVSALILRISEQIIGKWTHL